MDPFTWTSKDRTTSFIQQLYADAGYTLEDPPGAMDDRYGWRVRVREICAGSTTWWWWYVNNPIYEYSFMTYRFLNSYQICFRVYLPARTLHEQDVTRSIFKRSLNSEFSFSLTGFLTEVKEPNLSYLS